MTPRLLSLAGLVLTAGVAASAPPPVTALAYRPDGSTLAAGTRDVVSLIDPSKGTVTAELPGQTGRVTAVAFSASGWLAAASGEPGRSGIVRLYDLRVGKPAAKPAAEFPAHKDAIYTLAFSPDGKTLATAGYDRVIKLWDVPTPAAKPTPRLTLTDHSDAVYGLAFHPSGKLLASASADRAVKVWDTAKGKRLYTLSDPTDWVYAVAWSPDGRHIAAGGADKSVRVWEADADRGKLVRSAFAHDRAVTRLAFGDGKLFSAGEDRVVKVWDAAKLTETRVLSGRPQDVLAFAVRPDGKQVAVGRFDGVLEILDPATGKPTATPLPQVAKAAPPKPWWTDRFPVVAEQGATDSAHDGMRIKLPATVTGTIDRAGDIDFFRFDAVAGQQLGVQVQTAADRGKFDPVVTLVASDGRVLAEGANGLLGYTCPAAGSYAVAVHDREYRGGAGYEYRLHVGPLPVVTGIAPLGVTRGVETEVRVTGVNLGKAGLTAKVKPPADAAVGSKVPIPLPKTGEVLGTAEVMVGEFPAVAVADRAAVIPMIPGTADGVLAHAGEAHTVRFHARKGQRLVVETHAARFGSPVDTFVEVLDAAGRPVQRATLRCTARTFSTFRDHDSAGAGIRLETWNEVGIDDYLYVGGELMRIHSLPRGPDDDARFYAAEGRRLGFLDTTPTHHAQNTPMYKVEIHPPGAAFPPNGMPVFPLFFRNDDGGPGYGKDSRVVFDPPADGEYQARVTDANGAGGPTHAYRLTVRPPRADFKITLSPMSPKVWKGGAVPVTVTATRTDGFDGLIHVRFEGLVPPFRAPAVTIGAGQESTAVALSADGEAMPTTVGAFKAAARAVIDGKEVTREAAGGTPSVAEPGDLVTAVNVPELTIRPGSEARIVVKVQRRNGFTGRVPIEVRGLPHGVRVMNVGLNGILVLPNETEREVVIYAESWVKPTDEPFAVSAKTEKKGTEHGAPAVMLKVRK